MTTRAKEDLTLEVIRAITRRIAGVVVEQTIPPSSEDWFDITIAALLYLLADASIAAGKPDRQIHKSLREAFAGFRQSDVVH